MNTAPQPISGTRPSLIEVDILIVGGGIAGPALAVALKDTGLSILLVERSDEPLDTARGDHLQPRACDILEDWGVLDDMFKAGAEKRHGTVWMTSSGEIVHKVETDRLEVRHPYFMFLNHERISDVLIACAATNPNLQIMKPARFTGLDEKDGNEQIALVRHGANTCRVRAKMIVGADGRTSTVRQSCGIEAETCRYRNPLVILFARRDQPDPRNDLRAYVTERGVVSFVPRTGNQWKIGIPIETRELSVWKSSHSRQRSALLRDIVPCIQDLDTEIAGFYQPVQINSRHWVKDNVVILGDAAHAMHPGQSQGMNTSIRIISDLVDYLPTVKNFTAPDIRDSLARFERTIRPMIEPSLALNHKRGIEMDELSAESGHRQVEFLQQLASNATKAHSYAMRLAGFPSAD